MKFCNGWLISAVILLSVQNIDAQTDFPLSTLTSSSAQLNPAAAGLFNDIFRVHTYFKSQTAQSLSGGVKSTGLAADGNFIRNMGLGFVVFSNSVDRSALRDFNVLLSYAYRVTLSQWSLLSLGVQGGIKQVGFSTEDLHFGSQYDPSYKGGYNPNAQPSEIPQGNKNNFDASAGAYWQGYLNPYLALRAGAAVFHLVPVKTDFFSHETYLQPKYVFSANARYEGEYLHWVPSVMYVTQDEQSYAEIGVMTQFRDMNNFANIGVYYRSPNVIIPMIGIGLGKLSLNFSLEFYIKTNYSKIVNIGLSYFPQTNKEASVIQDVPDF